MIDYNRAYPHIYVNYVGINEPLSIYKIDLVFDNCGVRSEIEVANEANRNGDVREQQIKANTFEQGYEQ